MIKLYKCWLIFVILDHIYSSKYVLSYTIILYYIICIYIWYKYIYIYHVILQCIHSRRRTFGNLTPVPGPLPSREHDAKPPPLHAPPAFARPAGPPWCQPVAPGTGGRGGRGQRNAGDVEGRDAAHAVSGCHETWMIRLFWWLGWGQVLFWVILDDFSLRSFRYRNLPIYSDCSGLFILIFNWWFSIVMVAYQRAYIDVCCNVETYPWLLGRIGRTKERHLQSPIADLRHGDTCWRQVQAWNFSKAF